MSSTTAAPPVLRSQHAGRRPRAWLAPRAVLAGGAALSALFLAVALIGLLVDDRVITGAPAWMKPVKFGVSITVYLLTLRWVLSHVQGHRRLVGLISGVVIVALVVELAVIGGQVVRGTTSHFNASSPLDGALFSLMGMMISLVFLATLAAGVLVLRRRGLDAGLAAGLRWGIGVSLVGMAQAGLMISNTTGNPTGGHTVGAPDGGPGMPLTGWSLTHGDLRISHFVGLHALQLLPLLAWVLATRTGLGERSRARLVRVAGVATVGLVVLLSWQALRAQPLLQPDAATLLALAGLGVVTAAGAALVLRGRP